MNIGDFAEKICVAVERKLGRGFHTEVREVRKNNGIILHGILIMSEGQKIVPNIYLEHFLEDFESGTSFDTVVCRLLSVYQNDVPKENIDMGFFKTFETVKDRICYRLVGRKSNGALLEEIPHMDFLDMAVCFYYSYQNEPFGDGNILIYNSHMEMWDTCMEELFRLAQENTPRIFPWECSGLGEILEEASNQGGDSGSVFPEEEAGGTYPDIPMKVLSNRKRLHGAACILYPGVLDKIAGEKGNLFIIPSSIHETILLPDDKTISAGVLKGMIHEVNITQVSPDEVLSDSLYYYDAGKKEVVMA